MLASRVFSGDFCWKTDDSAIFFGWNLIDVYGGEFSRVEISGRKPCGKPVTIGGSNLREANAVTPAFWIRYQPHYTQYHSLDEAWRLEQPLH